MQSEQRRIFTNVRNQVRWVRQAYEFNLEHRVGEIEDSADLMYGLSDAAKDLRHAFLELASILSVDAFTHAEACQLMLTVRQQSSLIDGDFHMHEHLTDEFQAEVRERNYQEYKLFNLVTADENVVIWLDAHSNNPNRQEASDIVDALFFISKMFSSSSDEFQWVGR